MYVSAMSLVSCPDKGGLGLGPYIHLVYALSKDCRGRRQLSNDSYLESNQNNIRTRCDRLMQCLEEVGIPYYLEANLLVCVDGFSRFSAALIRKASGIKLADDGSQSFEGERGATRG